MQPALQQRHVVDPPAPVDIHPSVAWGTDVKIDVTGGITIAKGVNITHRVVILTHQHDGLTKAPSLTDRFGQLVLCPLNIDEYAFIGESAVIMPQVGQIGAWAVIGAFSVLTKPVGMGEIWAGNPARFIRMRDGMRPTLERLGKE